MLFSLGTKGTLVMRRWCHHNVPDLLYGGEEGEDPLVVRRAQGEGGVHPPSFASLLTSGKRGQLSSSSNKCYFCKDLAGFTFDLNSSLFSFRTNMIRIVDNLGPGINKCHLWVGSLWRLGEA